MEIGAQADLHCPALRRLLEAMRESLPSDTAWLEWSAQSRRSERTWLAKYAHSRDDDEKGLVLLEWTVASQQRELSKRARVLDFAQDTANASVREHIRLLCFLESQNLAHQKLREASVLLALVDEARHGMELLEQRIKEGQRSASEWRARRGRDCGHVLFFGAPLGPHGDCQLCEPCVHWTWSRGPPSRVVATTVSALPEAAGTLRAAEAPPYVLVLLSCPHVRAAAERPLRRLAQEGAPSSGGSRVLEGLWSCRDCGDREDREDREECVVCYDKKRLCESSTCGHALCPHCWAHILLSPGPPRCPLCRDAVVALSMT